MWLDHRSIAGEIVMAQRVPLEEFLSVVFSGACGETKDGAQATSSSLLQTPSCLALALA